MKRFLVFVVLLCIGGFLAGCGNGVVHTAAERMRRIRNIDDLRARQFVDDSDYVWLYDRPSYLTEWPVRATD